MFASPGVRVRVCRNLHRGGWSSDEMPGWLGAGFGEQSTDGVADLCDV